MHRKELYRKLAGRVGGILTQKWVRHRAPTTFLSFSFSFSHFSFSFLISHFSFLIFSSHFPFLSHSHHSFIILLDSLRTQHKRIQKVQEDICTMFQMNSSVQGGRALVYYRILHLQRQIGVSESRRETNGDRALEESGPGNSGKSPM